MQEVPKDVLLLLINRKSKHMLMDNLQEIIIIFNIFFND